MAAHQEVGLKLKNMWRQIEDPNNVYFVLDVADEERARAFVSSPEANKTGEISGVLDGEIHFVESVFE